MRVYQTVEQRVDVPSEAEVAANPGGQNMSGEPTQVTDADFDEQGVLLDYQSLGEGHTEVARQIELLKGMMYDGYLMFEWPKLWVDSLPAAEAVLPEVASWLRACVDNKQKILTAYKNDKNAPRLSPLVETIASE